MSTHAPWLSFELPQDFVDTYRDRRVTWGFPVAGGLSLGELAFATKYSRLDPVTGTKERWADVCRRVIEGTYSILKEHCLRRRTPWDEAKAIRSATEAFERMYTFKWLPPGRGLWAMGTAFVHERGDAGALQNCAFVSTGRPRGLVGAVERLMEMSMLGIGVGFDSEAAGGYTVTLPDPSRPVLHRVEDSREGWCTATGALLTSYLERDRGHVVFDYSQVRPRGALILGFGGVAAGPEPLRDFHDQLRDLLGAYALRRDPVVDTLLVGDVMNLAARCVVAGDVRRSAEIWLGHADDKQFLQAKNPDVNPARMAPGTGWGWASNNSVLAWVGGDYGHLADAIALNGEPGLVYLDLCREFGRLADAPNRRDYRVAGINPCGEQPLEDGEVCTLVNTYPTRAAALEDYLRTEKFAYLYAKAVTLAPTRWGDTNEIVRRNHRIGASMAGQAEFVERQGWVTLKCWQDAGYREVRRWDVTYAEWLGVRESIKVTTVKPDGTTALLVGCTPGVGFPTEDAEDGYLRRMRFGLDEPLVNVLAAAGIPLEPDVTDPRRVVAELPVRSLAVRGERAVSLWEKAELAASAQRWWSDNAVSCTLTFRPDEAIQVGAVIHAFDGRLKSVSFLPLGEALEPGAYPQMPYEGLARADLEARLARVSDVDIDSLYRSGRDAAGDAFCNTDRCELKLEWDEVKGATDG